MQLTITEAERAYLEELLRTVHGRLLHELHHTDTGDFKKLLREKAGINEGLQSKLSAVAYAEVS